jgi:zinc transporter ZupT
VCILCSLLIVPFSIGKQLVDVAVRLLSGDHHHHHHDSEDLQNMCNQNEPSTPHCVGCSDDPVGELNEWHQRAEREIVTQFDDNQRTIASHEVSNDNSSGGSDDEETGENDDLDTFEEHGISRREESNGNEDDYEINREQAASQQRIIENTPPENENQTKHEGDDPKLIRMGLCTAVAIAIHNFPEGLATFVAALEDPHVGAVLAIAIGLHNIPEGLCVALPIYYATGNRKKAFLWGCLSGLSEPVAALLGWAVLAKSMSQEVYATLFGLVSGMMVIISMKELLPTAHRYDPEDTVVTYSLIGGMALIALSLVLFKV